MKIESQVCSLELAKELKALGVKQEGTLFVYLKTKHAKGLYFATGHIQSLLNEPGHEWYAAFTVAELGEMLPWTFIAKRTSKFPEAEMFLMMSKDDSMDQKSFSIWYEGMHDDGEEFKWESIIEQNEADARAKMLIYLIKEGLLKV